MWYARNYPYFFFSSTSLRSQTKMDGWMNGQEREEEKREKRKRERKKMSNLVVVISAIDLHYDLESIEKDEKSLMDG